MAKLVEQVYASALFDLAKEEDKLQEVEQDFALFVDLLDEDPTFFEFYRSPIIAKDKKKEVLLNSLRDQMSELFFNFLMVLVEKNRGYRIKEMGYLFQGYVDESLGRSQALVESARELTEEQKALIKQKLEVLSNQEVRIKTKIKPDLLGGLRIHMGGRIIDTTLQSDLKAIRSLIETTIV